MISSATQTHHYLNTFTLLMRTIQSLIHSFLEHRLGFETKSCSSWHEKFRPSSSITSCKIYFSLTFQNALFSILIMC